MRTTNAARLGPLALIASLVLIASALLAGPAEAGSICRDGSWTASEGRGTCSSHGGVAQKGVPKPAGATVIGSGSSGAASSPDSSTNSPDPLESTSAAATGSDPATSALSSGGRDAALAVLGSLAVRPANAGGYARSKFRHWITQSDGCSTREAVLIRDATTVSANGCRIISGSWFSPYDATTWTSGSRLDIDHMVPLKEAWVSGASAWSADRRKSFANDMGWRGSLIAVSASSNRSKGDK
ncbi:MAG: DUF1524 domain-containing protein, partial [Actinomycetes bacterium]